MTKVGTRARSLSTRQRLWSASQASHGSWSWVGATEPAARASPAQGWRQRRGGGDFGWRHSVAICDKPCHLLVRRRVVASGAHTRHVAHPHCWMRYVRVFGRLRAHPRQEEAAGGGDDGREEAGRFCALRVWASGGMSVAWRKRDSRDQALWLAAKDAATWLCVSALRSWCSSAW